MTIQTESLVTLKQNTKEYAFFRLRKTTRPLLIHEIKARGTDRSLYCGAVCGMCFSCGARGALQVVSEHMAHYPKASAGCAFAADKLSEIPDGQPRSTDSIHSFRRFAAHNVPTALLLFVVLA